MAKRSTTSRNLRRAAQQPVPIPADTEELTLDQAKVLLKIRAAQLDVARQVFFRLASVRGADLVTYQGKSWDEGGQYINAEMHGLDHEIAKLAPVVQPPQEAPQT